ncbi:MAG: Pycsar system effector family protein [Nanoarchaeota archaeon]
MSDSNSRTDPKALAEYLSKNYAQLQGLMKQADTKANILIALIGAILSIFFNFLMSESNRLVVWQTATVLSLLLISGTFAILVIYPKISKPSGKFSLTYFKDAQNVDTEKWTKKLINSDQEELITKDIMDNIKIISSILDKKFNKLRIAYILFGASIFIKTIFDAIIWFY